MGPGTRNGRRSSRDGGERRGPGRIVGTVKEHVAAAGPLPDDQLQPSRPDRGRVAAPAGVVVGGDQTGRLERVEDRVGHRDVRGLVATPESDTRRSEPGQIHDDPVAIPVEERRGRHDAKIHAHPGRPSPDDAERGPGRPGQRHVAALDDRGLLAGDRGDRGTQPIHVVKVDVRDGGDPAIPRMGRVEPTAEAHLDQCHVEPRSREVREDDRREQFELGRVAEPPGDAVRDRQDLLDERGERRGLDRAPVDLDPLAVGDEVRLGRLADAPAGRAQGRSSEREDAALAIGPANEGATDRQLGIAEVAEEGARAPEAEPDPESPAVGQRTQRLVVGHRGRLGLTRA